MAGMEIEMKEFRPKEADNQNENVEDTFTQDSFDDGYLLPIENLLTTMKASTRK